MKMVKSLDYGKDKYGNDCKYSSTGETLVGFQIPKWNEIVKIVEEAMQIRKDIRWAAWDICVKENGIELVEGNISPGPSSFQQDAPKLNIVKKYWSEIKHERRI